jgi:hypothetical protein
VTIGFQATDEDGSEPTPEVLDGRADETEREPSMQEQCEIFRTLCATMRSMGAIDIRMGGFRATFPAPAQPPRAMPAPAREPRQTNSDDDKIPQLDGDGPEDTARRTNYRSVARLLAG